MSERFIFKSVLRDFFLDKAYPHSQFLAYFLAYLSVFSLKSRRWSGFWQTTDLPSITIQSSAFKGFLWRFLMNSVMLAVRISQWEKKRYVSPQVEPFICSLLSPVADSTLGCQSGKYGETHQDVKRSRRSFPSLVCLAHESECWNRRCRMFKCLLEITGVDQHGGFSLFVAVKPPEIQDHVCTKVLTRPLNHIMSRCVHCPLYRVVWV